MPQHWPGSIRLLECPDGSEYGEEAFQYFLGLEQARALRSRQPVRVLLATLEAVRDRPTAFPRASAAQLFKGLRSTLRDTDVVGWYRQDRIAGAVLSFPPHASPVGTVFESRIEADLRRRLPPLLAKQLRLRMVRPDGAALTNA